MSVELPTKVVDNLPKNPEAKTQQVDKQTVQTSLDTTDALKNLAENTESQLKTKPEINELLKDLGDAKTNLNSLTDFVKKNPEAKNIPENQKEILDIFGGWHLYGSLIKTILNSKKPEYNVLESDKTINIDKLKNIISSLEAEYSNSFQNFQIADFDKFISKKIGGVNIFDPAENNLVKILDSTKSGDNIYKKYIYQNRAKHLAEMENFLVAYNSYAKKSTTPSTSTTNSTPNSPNTATSTTTNATSASSDNSGTQNPNTGAKQPSYPQTPSGQEKNNQIKDFLTQNAEKIGIGGLGILGLYLIFRKKNKTENPEKTDENHDEEKGSFFKTLLKWGGIGAVGFFAYSWFKKQMGSQNGAPETPNTNSEIEKSMENYLKLPPETRKQYDDIGKNIDSFFDARLPKTNISGLWIGSFDNSYDDETLPGYITYLSSANTVEQTLKGQEVIKKAIDANSSGSEFVDKLTKGTFDLNSISQMASLYALDIAKKNNIGGIGDIDAKYKDLENKPIIGGVLKFLKTLTSGKKVTQEDINTFFKGQLQENPNFYQEFSAIILGQFLKTQNYFLSKKNIILYESIKKNIPNDFILPSGKKYIDASSEEKSLAIQQILDNYNKNGDIDKNLKSTLDKLNTDFKNSTITGKDNYQKFFTPEVLTNNSEYDKILETKDKLTFGKVNQKIENIVGNNNIFDTKNLDSGTIKGVLDRFQAQANHSEANSLENILGVGYAFGNIDNLKNSILEKFKNPELTKIKNQIATLKQKPSYTQEDLDTIKNLLSEYGNIEKEALMLKDTVSWSIDQADGQEQFSMKIAIGANYFSSSWAKALDAIKDMTIGGNIKNGMMEILSLKFGEKAAVITPIAVPLIGLKALKFLTSPTKLAKFGILTAGKLAYKLAPEALEKTSIKFLGEKLGTKIVTKLGAKAAVSVVPYGGWILTGIFMAGDIIVDRQGRADMGNMLKDFGFSMWDKMTGWDKNYENGLNQYQTYSNNLFNDLSNTNVDKQKIQLRGLQDSWKDMGEKNRKMLIQGTALNLITVALASNENFQKDPNQDKILNQIKSGISIDGMDSNGLGAKLVLKNPTPYDGALQQAFNEWYTPFMAFNSGNSTLA